MCLCECVCFDVCVCLYVCETESLCVRVSLSLSICICSLTSQLLLSPSQINIHLLIISILIKRTPRVPGPFLKKKLCVCVEMWGGRWNICTNKGTHTGTYDVFCCMKKNEIKERIIEMKQ